MKISTKGRYGLRFLLDLVVRGPGARVTLKDVSRRQEISEKYLWQVVSPLKKAGILRSETGPGGGYTLASKPEDITLYDILSALEGVDILVECTSDRPVCLRSSTCVAREVWRDLEQKIHALLKDSTLQELAEKQHRLDAHATINFNI